jgi:hypothetical protein
MKQWLEMSFRVSRLEEVAPVAQGIEQRFPNPLPTFQVLKNQQLTPTDSFKMRFVHPWAGGQRVSGGVL